MELVKEILINYWKPTLALLLLIVSFILLIVKKKPVQVVDLIAKCIYEILPMYINLTECDLTIKGSRKKEKCLQYVEDWFKSNNIQFTSYYREITEKAIEAILSTPQKHETK